MAEDPFKRRPPLPKQRKPLLITQSEVENIISNAQPRPTEEEMAEALEQEHAERIKASKALADLVRQGQQAGKEKLKRQFNKELGGIALDLDQEAKGEATLDRVLDQAYRRLYLDTDRVKYFNSARDFSEMLLERDEQRKAKAGVKNQFAAYDSAMVLGMIKDVDAFEDEEKEKRRVKEEMKRVNAHNLAVQYKEKLRNKEEERWNKVKEGFLIRDEDARDQKDDTAAKIQKRLQQQAYKKELEDQQNTKRVLFDAKQQIQEAEEAKDQLFNDAKQEMMLDHRRYMDEMERKKESHKREIATSLSDAAAVRRAQEAAALEKAVLQADEKARDEDLLRQLERKEATEAFLKHYHQEMAAKERQKYQQRLEGYQERKRIDDNVERLDKEDKDKQGGRGHLEREAQHIQMHQIARKRGEAKQEQLENIKDYMNHMRSLDCEEDVFQKYAAMEIEKAEAKGMNTYAMKKAARPGIECGKGPLFKDRGHIRPRYYSAAGSKADDISRVERKKCDSNTKNKLGFML